MILIVVSSALIPSRCLVAVSSLSWGVMSAVESAAGTSVAAVVPAAAGAAVVAAAGAAVVAAVDFFAAVVAAVDFFAAVVAAVDFFAAVVAAVDFFAAVVAAVDFFAAVVAAVDFFAAVVVPASAPYIVIGILAIMHMLIIRAVFLSPVTILFIFHPDSFFFNSSFKIPVYFPIIKLFLVYVKEKASHHQDYLLHLKPKNTPSLKIEEFIMK